MIHRLGKHAQALLEAMEARGALTAREASTVAGVDFNTARKYLYRCVSRGLMHRLEGESIQYCAAKGWRDVLEPKKATKEPARRQKNAAFELQSIWKN